MPDQVRAAQEFFDDLDSDTVKKYTCPFDGYATDEELRFQKHMHVNHKQNEAQPAQTAVLTAAMDSLRKERVEKPAFDPDAVPPEIAGLGKAKK